ncbi:hypothetical protein AAZX31_06G015800 [Glycine max]|uniref:Uncharacterized protein n=1 Tax=Glycine max TaxID=3847 RepID=A0A0R0JID5_SOYBN|nr:hypothetical protein GYH30_013788 [Glycine max]KRH51588.1 hypothetical protein GLYMA_06G016600v4 [Glycine max]
MRTCSHKIYSSGVESSAMVFVNLLPMHQVMVCFSSTDREPE